MRGKTRGRDTERGQPPAIKKRLLLQRPVQGPCTRRRGREPCEAGFPPARRCCRKESGGVVIWAFPRKGSPDISRTGSPACTLSYIFCIDMKFHEIKYQSFTVTEPFQICFQHADFGLDALCLFHIQIPAAKHAYFNLKTKGMRTTVFTRLPCIMPGMKRVRLAASSADSSKSVSYTHLRAHETL